MEPSQGYRQLALSDLELAARIMAQAFVDDPLCAFMLPSRRTRPTTLYRFFRAFGEVSIKHERGYGAGEPLQGVAYWKSPDQEGLSISIKSIGKFIPLLVTPYPIGYLRARAVFRQIEAMHQKYASDPHYYLDNLGVLPSAQGQAISSRLIRPFLKMADSQGVSCYTETVTSSNVALYEHFGFQCLEEHTVTGTGITVWALRRSPLMRERA
jgi:ribosomal protein S18 acetylase RimI-like enzyme